MCSIVMYNTTEKVINDNVDHKYFFPSYLVFLWKPLRMQKIFFDAKLRHEFTSENSTQISISKIYWQFILNVKIKSYLFEIFAPISSISNFQKVFIKQSRIVRILMLKMNVGISAIQSHIKHICVSHWPRIYVLNRFFKISSSMLQSWCRRAFLLHYFPQFWMGP